MSGELNMIQTLRKFRGGQTKQIWGGASLEKFSGEAQLEKSPCKLLSFSSSDGKSEQTQGLSHPMMRTTTVITVKGVSLVITQERNNQSESQSTMYSKSLTMGTVFEDDSPEA